MKTILSILLVCLITQAAHAQAKRNQADNVIFLVSGKIKPGELKNFQAVLNELVNNTKATEPNTVDYTCYLSPDSTTFQFYERYADSPAAMIHLKTFNEKFAARVNASTEVTGFSLCGMPSDELSKALGGTKGMLPLSGFSR